MMIGPLPAGGGAGPVPSARDAGDVRLLCALAASHSLFGRYDTALRFLALAGWIEPSAARVMELRAMIELRRGHVDAAWVEVTRLGDHGHEVPDVLRIVERRIAVRAGAAA